jgi:hypothetical protein
MALPTEPPWRDPRKRKRTQTQFSFVHRVQSRRGTVRNWINIVNDKTVKKLPWGDEECFGEGTIRSQAEFDSRVADDLLERLNPLEYYQRFMTVTGDGFLKTMSEKKFQQQALIAATDLTATYKASKHLYGQSIGNRRYVLEAVDDLRIPVVLDTGASVSVTPNISDFIGEIKRPNCPTSSER